MTFDTATAQTAVEVDYSLPEYSEEELAEMEREDEAYFTPEKMAILRERFDRVDKIFGHQSQVADQAAV